MGSCAAGVADILQPIVANLGSEPISQAGDSRIVGIEQHRCIRWQALQRSTPCLCNRINLTIAVELIAEQVMQHDQSRLCFCQCLRECRLIDLEQAQLGSWFAGQCTAGKSRRGKPGHKIGTSAIMQQVQPALGHDRCEHACGSSLAVCPPNEHYPLCEPGAEPT